MKRLALLLVVAACGRTAAPPPASAGPPAALVAVAPADDPVVAQVNGRPVHGSCVQAQAARGAPARVALEQCIDFELLAQAAERRGIAIDPEVAFATRTALVSALVAREFEDKLTSPADLGDFWTQAISRNARLVKHAEYRTSAYVRVPVAEGAPVTVDEQARQLAQKIADTTAHETGLLSPQFFAIANGLAPVSQLQESDVEPHTKDGLEENYAQALFSIHDIGRTAGPVRTKWGWDIVLWTDVIPAADPTPEDIAKQFFPDVKRAYFATWVNQIAKSLGIRVELVQQNVARLEDLP